MEPGLALMDEIGRTALTNAFIRFSRENCHINPYKPLYWDTSELVKNGEEQIASEKYGKELETNDDYNMNSNNLRKCPSDPYIQKGFQTSEKSRETSKDKQYDNLPSMMITPASVSNSTSWQAGSAVQIAINNTEQKLECSSPSTSRSFTPSENIE
jgi:hypothetical protein